VRMIVFVADKDSFAGASHAMLDIVLFEALEARKDGGILFRLSLFSAECVVGERVEADCLGLVGVEGFGEDRRIRGL